MSDRIPIDYSKITEDVWVTLKDAQTIRLARKDRGLKPLSAATLPCFNRECKKLFLTQTIGGRRVQYYCAACHAGFRNAKSEI